MIQLKDVTKSYGTDSGVVALKNITLTVGPAERVAVMGPSGSGKSTLLNLVCGLDEPTSGSVKIFGQEITTMNDVQIAEIRRRFGMLFQSGALLASLTVGENVALPLLQHTDMTVDEVEETITQKLQMVGLNGFNNLKPAEISGGMRKRVGLARALALDPELLFSDEPTSGLDPIMTAVVDKLTLELTKSEGMTAVVVTHDMTSAFRIATRMIMLGRGRILAQGTPEEIRTNPDPEVQQFINGEADGPMPLNLSQDDHSNHQHVQARPLVSARRRFHQKMP
jgi:phospholipid/cholesterol/gamma-HCH transport system ATP-binding protein